MPPKTPIQAIAWEIYRVSRRETLLRLGGILALLFGILPFAQLTDATVLFVRGLTMAFLMSTSIFSATWMSSLDNRNAGFSFRLGFTKPVPTRILVAVPMLVIIFTSIVIYLVPAICARTVFGLEFPLVAPVAIVACLVSLFLCATWSATTVPGRILGVTGVAVTVVTLLVFAGRNFSEPGIISLGRLELFEFTAVQYTILAAVIAAAFAVTIFAVDRQRHGEPWTLFGFESIRNRMPVIARRSTASRVALTPFRGPLHAQFWYEMYRSGRWLLLFGCVAACGLFAMVSLLIVFGLPPEKSPRMWLAILAVVPIILQMIGVEWCVQLRRRQGSVELSKFDAVRSLRNDQLILVKLLVITIGSLSGWLMIAAAAALHTAIWQTFDRWQTIAQALSPLLGGFSLWWIATGISFVWLFLCSAAIVMAFGMWFPRHPRLFLAAAVVVYANGILALIDYRRGWTLAPLWTAYVWLIGAGTVLFCLWTIRRALHSAVLSPKYFVAATGLWLIYVVTIVVLVDKSWAKLPTIPLAAAPLAIGAVLLSLAATAVAPLSLAAHRHQ